MPTRSSGAKDSFTRLLRSLPVPVKTALKRGAPVVDPLLIAAHRARSGNRMAVPPMVFRTRIGTAWSVADYFDSGRVVADAMTGALQVHYGKTLSDFPSILDFGAGCGRVVQFVAPAAQGSSCSACDVDEQAVHWARDHMPHVAWQVNSFDPPLPYADASFDLVYSISIFTHIDRDSQDRWLEELHRVLRPGGMALVTVAGETIRQQFRTGQMVSNTSDFTGAIKGSDTDEDAVAFFPYERSNWNEADFPGIGANYGMTFNDPADVAGRWSQTFDVLDQHAGAINNGQDLVVMRRRD